MLRPMPKDPFVRTLVAAADQSIVAYGAQQTVSAGYHWFSDWGRAPIIALRGLTLVTGRLGVVDGAIHHRLLQGGVHTKFVRCTVEPQRVSSR
jgi:glycogen debranching enzyme